MKNFLKNLKEPFVIIMCGPPLSGKSTLINNWISSYNGSINIISRDTILLEQAGTNNYSDAFKTVNQKNVDKILIESIETASLNKNNVIIDMTNLSSKRRKYNLSFFTDDYQKIGVILPFLKKEELFKRNEKRKIEENKFIPEHVIINMMESYSPIKDNEGFDKIICL